MQATPEIDPGHAAAAGAGRVDSGPVDAVPVDGGGRLAIIDGLRGIAAMLVVVYHLSDASYLRGIPVLGPLMAHGNFGVEVFFVISGFVIAYSVRKAAHTLPFLGRFALRRALRLDPPYWVTIAGEIALLHLGLMWFPDHEVTIPTAQSVWTHLFYLQGLLGSPPILSIFWTLCYEVQFYLALVGALVVVRSITLRWPTLRKQSLLIALAGASFVYSLSIDAGVVAYPLRGLFVDRWYQFCLGILTLAVVIRWVPAWTAIVSFAVVGAFLAFGPSTLHTAKSALVCVATSMVILLSTRSVGIRRIAESRVLQFLGRISYSLYLIHVVVAWRFVSLALRQFPPGRPLALRAALFLAGVLLSVGAAWVMHRLVEKPSLKLAGRISTAGRAA